MARCHSCHRPIFWVSYPPKEEGGKRALAPLDEKPTDQGNVVLDHPRKHTATGAILAHVTTAAERAGLDPDVPRYMPHHATCPTVEQHRRRP